MDVAAVRPVAHLNGMANRTQVRLTFMPRFVKKVSHDLQSKIQTLCEIGGGGGGEGYGLEGKTRLCLWGLLARYASMAGETGGG